MEPGTIGWIAAKLTEAGGPLPEEALAAGLPPDEAAGLAARLLASPLFVLTGRGWILLAPHLQGATFRYALTEAELAGGALRLEGRAAMAALQQSQAFNEGTVRWKPVGDEPPTPATLVRGADGWALPGLGLYFAGQELKAGDDLLVHVRNLDPPCLVLDAESRFERDEAAIERSNVRLVEAALAILDSEGGGWLRIDRLSKRLLARHDHRRGVPPDAFSERLLPRDDRFTLSKDGLAVRPSHFRRDDTAKLYLSRLRTSLEALPAFLEEYPPNSDADRERAMAVLDTWWRDTPRPELGGRTPAMVEHEGTKIVPFQRREPRS